MKPGKSRSIPAEATESRVTSVGLLHPSNTVAIQQFIDDLPHPLWVMSKDQQQYFNTAMIEYLGINLNDSHHLDWHHFIHSDDLQAVLDQWHIALSQQQNIDIQCRIQQPEGNYRICRLKIKYCPQPEHLLQWSISLTDLQDYIELQQQLAQSIPHQHNMLDGPAGKTGQIYHSDHQILRIDPLPQNDRCTPDKIGPQTLAELQLNSVSKRDELTGLYNRNTFYRTFKQVLSQAKHQNKKLGLLLIDLDYFRHINDTLGHLAGDHLLHILGQRFQNCFAANTLVARLGGDEFAVLVQDLKSEEQLIATAQLAYQQLKQPVGYLGHSMRSAMSIGCAIYPRDALSSSNLLKSADIALNDLKNSGRGGIRMFNQEMSTSLNQITQQLTLARKIIHADQIVPYYQPKVRLSDGAVIGFEALLRWQDRHQQIQLPSDIFGAFQDYELASRISETMQLKVFADMSRWQAQGLELLPISINAAPVEFLRDNYAEKLLARLARFDIPTDKVELEITEQSLSESGAHYVVRALNLLKQAGIHISLDDFGTGHSSLTRLQEYPVDCIKIDRNFVERMNTDPSALAIVKAITQIGSSISLDILVEGIENTEQLDTLMGCDCQIGQGFYFYRPMSGESAQLLLRSTG